MSYALLAITLLTVGSAAVAISLRTLVRSVLLLIGSWAGIAGFYLWAGAEFVAFAQLLVYVGAVSMVVLFAVILTRRGHDEPRVLAESLRRISAGIAAGAGVLAVLIYAILQTPLHTGPQSANVPQVNVHQLGTELMGPHVAAVLVMALILTVALVGGVVIASTDRPHDKGGA